MAYAQYVLAKCFRYIYVNPIAYAEVPLGSFVEDLAGPKWDFLSVASICSQAQRARWEDAITNHVVTKKLPPEVLTFSTADSSEVLASLGLKVADIAAIQLNAEKNLSETLTITIENRVLHKIEDATWTGLINSLETDPGNNLIRTMLWKRWPEELGLRFKSMVGMTWEKKLKLTVVRAIIQASRLKVVGEYKISNDLRLSGNVTPHPGVPSVEGAGNYRAARESRMHMNVTSEEGFTYGATFVKLRYSVTANSGKHRLSKMEVIDAI